MSSIANAEIKIDEILKLTQEDEIRKFLKQQLYQTYYDSGIIPINSYDDFINAIAATKK